jgi:hypothetical protein
MNITNKTTTIDIEDLINTHGEEKADELLEYYKQFHKPDIELTPDFAIQVVRELPHGFAKVDPDAIEWRLYNPDSDYMLEWAECYRLVLPNGCHANIEVLDYTYYVDVEDADGEVHECYNADSWEELAPVIEEFYNDIQQAKRTEIETLNLWNS